MQNLNFDKIKWIFKFKGTKMKNIVLIFGAIIMATIFNACGIAQISQDSRIDSSDSKHTISLDWEIATL